MTVEERVARILAEIGEDVRPLPDPYERVRAGFRRRRRRQHVGLGLVMVTLLSVTGVALAGGPGRGPDETAERELEQGWPRVVAWTWRLADSPPRGAVAADTGYTTALADQVLERQRRGEIGAVGTPFTEARTLFVDDVGPYRIGLVALVRADPQPNFWPHAATWLVASKGASPERLAAGSRGMGDALEPYMGFHGGGPGASDEEVFVGLGPAGCEFRAATWPEERDWKPEPTGSYLVRTEGTKGREWWRLTCDGVVRQMEPAPGSLLDQPLTATQLAELASTARHGPEPAGWRDAISSLAFDLGYAAADLPQAIWAGRISGTTPGVNGSFDGNAFVVAAKAAGGRWVGEVQITYDQVDPATGSTGRGVRFASTTDPTDPSTVLAIQLSDREPAPDVLVIAPEGADRVVATRGGREVGRAAVVDGAALLTVPATADLEIGALGPDGVVHGGRLTGGTAELPVHKVYDWDK